METLANCIIKKRTVQVVELDLLIIFSRHLENLDRWIKNGCHDRYDLMLKSWGFRFIPSR